MWLSKTFPKGLGLYGGGQNDFLSLKAHPSEVICSPPIGEKRVGSGVLIAST